MRILITLILISPFLSNAYCQKKGRQFTMYTTVGLKFAGGGSFVNSAALKSDPSIDNRGMSGTYLYGGKFSLGYIGTRPTNTILAIHGDVLFGNFSKKVNDIHYNSSDTVYNKKIGYKSRDIVILLRYTHVSSRIYVELGPQFSVIQSVKETNSIDHPYFSSANSLSSKTTIYNSYNSLVIGAGYYIKRLLVGIRYCHSLNGINISGTGPMADGLYNYPFTASTYDEKYPATDKVNKGAILVTVEYYLPLVAFGRASCGGKGFSLFKGIDTGYYWGRKGNWYD